MDNNKNTKDFDLDKFVSDLEKVQVHIKEKEFNSNNINLKNLTKDMVQSNINQFSFVLSSRASGINDQKIERIYSKNEIREMVCANLIPEYQHEIIINAVTEYIYGIHVSTV